MICNDLFPKILIRECRDLRELQAAQVLKVAKENQVHPDAWVPQVIPAGPVTKETEESGAAKVQWDRADYQDPWYDFPMKKKR